MINFQHMKNLNIITVTNYIDKIRIIRINGAMWVYGNIPDILITLVKNYYAYMIYMYMFTYTHNLHIHINTGKFIHIYVCIYMHIYINTYMYIHTYRYIYVYRNIRDILITLVKKCYAYIISYIFKKMFIHGGYKCIYRISDSNYLTNVISIGEILFWWSIFIGCSSTFTGERTYGYFAILSPVFITSLLFGLSGLPLLEFGLNK
jgi:hypothetical protein